MNVFYIKLFFLLHKKRTSQHKYSIPFGKKVDRQNFLSNWLDTASCLAELRPSALWPSIY